MRHIFVALYVGIALFAASVAATSDGTGDDAARRRSVSPTLEYSLCKPGAKLTYAVEVVDTKTAFRGTAQSTEISAGVMELESLRSKDGVTLVRCRLHTPASGEDEMPAKAGIAPASVEFDVTISPGGKLEYNAGEIEAAFANVKDTHLGKLPSGLVLAFVEWPPVLEPQDDPTGYRHWTGTLPLGSRHDPSLRFEAYPFQRGMLVTAKHEREGSSGVHDILLTALFREGRIEVAEYQMNMLRVHRTVRISERHSSADRDERQ